MPPAPPPTSLIRGGMSSQPAPRMADGAAGWDLWPQRGIRAGSGDDRQAGKKDGRWARGSGRHRRRKRAKAAAARKQRRRPNLDRLAAEIARHNVLYYQKDAPEISDAEYDALVARAGVGGALPCPPQREDRPWHQVGAPPAAGFAKVRHGVPMLSLENVFDAAGFAESHPRHPPLPRPCRRRSRCASPPNRRSTGCRSTCCTEDGRFVRGADARRRRGGRGHHRQSATTLKDLPAAPCRPGAGAHRNPRRRCT